MAFTIHCFSENNTPDGTLQEITPVVDPTIRERGNFIFLKNALNLFGGQFMGGALAQRAYFESPELRKENYFEITPVEVGGVVAEAIDYRLQPASPIELPMSEPIRCFFEATAGAARIVTGIIWLHSGDVAPATGRIFHARLTATITEVAGAWTEGEMVFDQELPVGRYQIVGARCQCVDDGVAFRLISLDQILRPGGLCVNGPECPDLREQRNGGLGIWMEFDHDSPPSLEVLSFVGGDAAQEITLDLIKVG